MIFNIISLGIFPDIYIRISDGIIRQNVNETTYQK